MKKYSATARKTNLSLQVDAHTRGIHNILDEPEDIGGANTGLNPVEMELGALGASLQETARKIADDNLFNYEKLVISLEGDLDFRGFMGDPNVRNGFQEIRISYDFKTQHSKEECQRFVQLIEQNSPIFDTLANGTNVNISNIIKD
ncbi:OsmC family protein [Limosilactobacillus caccae]|uniref:OsmC family protein n=1 Tax=Limosilactobacillus caccae TaxID=1926284 RepID=UPI000970D037|nr:OsmC family protein [Limosilactobacillus caccae]